MANGLKFDISNTLPSGNNLTVLKPVDSATTKHYMNYVPTYVNWKINFSRLTAAKCTNIQAHGDS